MTDIIPFPSDRIPEGSDPTENARRWLATRPAALDDIAIRLFASQNKIREEHARQIWDQLVDDEREEWRTNVSKEFEHYASLAESWAKNMNRQSMLNTMSTNDMVLDNPKKYLKHLNDVASRYNIMFDAV